MADAEQFLRYVVDKLRTGTLSAEERERIVKEAADQIAKINNEIYTLSERRMKAAAEGKPFDETSFTNRVTALGKDKARFAEAMNTLGAGGSVGLLATNFAEHMRRLRVPQGPKEAAMKTAGEFFAKEEKAAGVKPPSEIGAQRGPGFWQRLFGRGGKPTEQQVQAKLTATEIGLAVGKGLLTSGLVKKTAKWGILVTLIFTLGIPALAYGYWQQIICLPLCDTIRPVLRNAVTYASEGIRHFTCLAQNFYKASQPGAIEQACPSKPLQVPYQPILSVQAQAPVRVSALLPQFFVTVSANALKVSTYPEQSYYPTINKFAVRPYIFNSSGENVEDIRIKMQTTDPANDACVICNILNPKVQSVCDSPYSTPQDACMLDSATPSRTIIITYTPDTRYLDPMTPEKNSFCFMLGGEMTLFPKFDVYYDFQTFSPPVAIAVVNDPNTQVTLPQSSFSQIGPVSAIISFDKKPSNIYYSPTGDAITGLMTVDLVISEDNSIATLNSLKLIESPPQPGAKFIDITSCGGVKVTPEFSDGLVKFTLSSTIAESLNVQSSKTEPAQIQCLISIPPASADVNTYSFSATFEYNYRILRVQPATRDIILSYAGCER